MMVDVSTIIVALFTLLGGGGVFFEAGRRIGRLSREQKDHQTDVEELDNKLDDKFSELEQQLAIQQHRRLARESVMLNWLENIHQAISGDIADVERPPEVQEDVDIPVDDNFDIGPGGDD